MKQEKMIQYMGLLDSKYIAEAAPSNAMNINKRKTRRTSLIVKYGSLAASFVLIIGALLAMPYLQHDDPVFSDQTDNAHDSTDPIEDTSYHGSESTDTDREPDEQDGQISGGIKATEYNSLTTSFEGFSGIWADCIDGKLIREWASAYEGMDHAQFIENVNIYTFIRALNIPTDMFYEVCYLTNDYYSTDYDIELLYHGTLDDVKEYYRNSQEREAEFYKKNNELKIKMALSQLIKTKDSESAAEYYEWTKEKYKNSNYKYVTNPTNTEWRIWSIAEFIYKFNISREEMEKIINVYNSNEKNITYDYDLDLIYNSRERVENLIAEKSPMEVDELIHIQ
ncbi:MAG: hypothetical protein IJF49_08145 [Clostridia bacterium]|nr:hypothetical protein [Clostridia bacterium]